MMNDELALTFTTRELDYLGSLFRPPAGQLVASFASPQDETASRKAARSALAEKGYIRLTADGEEGVVLDTLVATLIGVVGDPQAMLSVSTLRQKAPRPDQWQICAARGLLVSRAEDPPGVHSLAVCRTTGAAQGRLTDFLELRRQPAAHGEPFQIAAEVMSQLLYVIAGDGMEAAIVFLGDRGAPTGAAARLVAALDNPIQQSTIQATVWRAGEPRRVGHLTLLEGIYGLWLFAPLETDGAMLAVTPIAADAAVERVRRLAAPLLAMGQLAAPRPTESAVSRPLGGHP